MPITRTKVALTLEQIEAMHRIAAYLIESEEHDFYEQDEPASHLYRDAHALAQIASQAEKNS
jgi:hypothetical protein